MNNVVSLLLAWMDRRMEQAVRSNAQNFGRRSFIAKCGAILAGGSVLPLLPYNRNYGSAWADASRQQDDTKCDYWAYCGLDGTLCNACGGSVSQCPPGAQPSKLSWIGTCTNPSDKKAYLISYSDCCGKAPCQEDPDCSRHEGERPGYRIGTLSDMNWCMANTNFGVNCSTAVVVGIADSE
jgi:methylamine dehydrogenase light chain